MVFSWKPDKFRSQNLPKGMRSLLQAFDPLYRQSRGSVPEGSFPYPCSSIYEDCSPEPALHGELDGPALRSNLSLQ